MRPQLFDIFIPNLGHHQPLMPTLTGNSSLSPVSASATTTDSPDFRAVRTPSGEIVAIVL